MDSWPTDHPSSPFSPDADLVEARPGFCRHCQEALWVREQRCRRCERLYDPQQHASFLTSRTFERFRYWLPGLTLAMISGVVSYAICLQTGELGLGLFVAVPLSVGAIMGYSVRCYLWVTSCLVLAAVLGIVFTLISMHLAGFFCGLTLVLIFTGPAMTGMLLGWTLRLCLQHSRWDQRAFLPLAAFILLPYATQAVECTFAPEHAVAEVRTELTLDATPQEVWDSLLFYEEVDMEPPFWLGLVLPKPKGSTGDKSRPGQLVRCHYDRGHIVKRIRAVDPAKRLAFDIVEQQLHFERDVQLLDGSFKLQPIGKSRTKVTLTTRYQRKLAPQWIWQPIEVNVIHTLHGHVLLGMEKQLQCRAGHRSWEGSGRNRS